MTATGVKVLNFPHVIGDPTGFAIKVDLDEHYNREWLLGKIAYAIGSEEVGDYNLGTSLRDVLLQMHLILSDANQRKSSRFVGQNKESIFNTVCRTLFGSDSTGLEEIAVEECWAKHNITLPVDVFDHVRVLQFDEGDESRIIWQTMIETGQSKTHEVRVPIGITESVFKELFALLNALLAREESIRTA